MELHPDPDRVILEISNLAFTEGTNTPYSSNSRTKRGRKVTRLQRKRHMLSLLTTPTVLVHELRELIMIVMP